MKGAIYYVAVATVIFSHVKIRKGKIYLSAVLEVRVLEVSFLLIVFGILNELKDKPFKKTMFLRM